jgi:predicted esterase
MALLVLSPAALAKKAPAPPIGLQRDVTFTAYPGYARNGELLRRLRSPLQALHVEASLAKNPGVLRAQPLDPAQQHFALYVPPGPVPPQGYALLVFVPPWDDARVPAQWIPVLDRTRTIFVSAARSGNDADVFNRREPLALVAAYNVMQRYRTDPNRVYVGGFSGGSRVALRLALGYPDVFRGALLDAGSDPIGTARIPLPPADLLHRFRQSTRIVFLTGDLDALHQTQQARAGESLRQWCVFDTASVTLLRTGHVLADPAGFARGLDALSHATVPDARKLATCNAGIEAALDSTLRQVRALINAGRFEDARRALAAVDARYGGFAAPRSVELQHTIDARESHAR